jgi:hypothetical protein
VGVGEAVLLEKGHNVVDVLVGGEATHEYPVALNSLTFFGALLELEAVLSE